MINHKRKNSILLLLLSFATYFSYNFTLKRPGNNIRYFALNTRHVVHIQSDNLTNSTVRQQINLIIPPSLRRNTNMRRTIIYGELCLSETVQCSTRFYSTALDALRVKLHSTSTHIHRYIDSK